jgi:Zn finger protein HypA/HybF involved in hydrogenase expression
VKRPKIFNFSKEREQRVPHTLGPATCEACGHKEGALFAELGRIYFSCPKCGVPAMRRDDPVLPPEYEHRQACPQCDGQTFAVARDYLLCSTCGTKLLMDWTLPK